MRAFGGAVGSTPTQHRPRSFRVAVSGWRVRVAVSVWPRPCGSFRVAASVTRLSVWLSDARPRSLDRLGWRFVSAGAVLGPRRLAHLPTALHSQADRPYSSDPRALSPNMPLGSLGPNAQSR